MNRQDYAETVNPSRLDALPKFKGFPVPYFATMRVDGTPDFKLVDEDKRQKCATDLICWICGHKLDYWIYFVGGPLAIKNRKFVDGPMHRECAEEALRICPFLIGSTDYGAPADMSRHANAFGSQRTHTSDVPPDDIGLYRTRGFDLLATNTSWLFWAKPPKEVVWRPRVLKQETTEQASTHPEGEE